MQSLFCRTAVRTVSLVLSLLISGTTAIAQYELTSLTSNQKGKASRCLHAGCESA